MNQSVETLRVALVTGAARRIGAAIAQSLHQAGFRVVIHYHKSAKEALALAAMLNQQRPDSALALCQDLQAEGAAAAIMDAVWAFGSRLDVLVNNASVFIKGNSAWEVQFNTNVKAPFLLSHQAFPLLQKNQGVIINITDIHGEKPLKDYPVYSQTKAALRMQTLALAVEFAPLVRVNAVAPGAIIWPEQDNTLTLETQQKIIEKTLLKKHGNPDYIAQAVLALVENRYVTGQVWVVDGGRSLK